MLEALSKSVLLFLIAPILVELRPTKKLRQNMLYSTEEVVVYAYNLLIGSQKKIEAQKKKNHRIIINQIDWNWTSDITLRVYKISLSLSLPP